MAWPNQKPGIVTYQTTHFDLVPTLFRRILGVSNPIEDYSVGRDFFSIKQTSFVISGNYAYFALIMKNHILIFHDSGMYRFTDLDMRPSLNTTINTMLQKQALFQMTRYSSSSR